MAVVLYLTEIFDKANTRINPGLQATLVCLVQVIGKRVISKYEYPISIEQPNFLKCHK